MKQFFQIIFWLGVIVFAVIFLRWSWSLDAKIEAAQPEKTWETMSEADKAASARYTCRNFIKQVLNDPGSAEWTIGTSWQVESDGNEIFAVYPSLRAKNAFGALVLSTFRCELRHSGDGWVLQSLEEQ